MIINIRRSAKPRLSEEGSPS